jgi:hypothetical protein
MNELTLAIKAADWPRLKALVLDSVSSPITRRIYGLGRQKLLITGCWRRDSLPALRASKGVQGRARWKLAIDAAGLKTSEHAGSL